MKIEIMERIELNPNVMLGKQVIKGTRIPVEIILKKLSQDISVDEILSDYPKLKRKDVQAAIAYAAATVSTDEVFLAKAFSV